MRFSYVFVVALLALFSVSFLIGISSAQLGEVAGEPTFYVNISSTYHYNYTFINQGATPIPFKTIMTNFKTSAKNSTLPIVTVTPSTGTIPPNSQIHIEVSVYLPAKNNTPGMQWQAVLEVVANSTSSKVGGAVIDEGVAKIITIVATSAKPNYTAYILGGIAIVAIVIGVIAGLYVKRNKKAAKRTEKIAERKSGKSISTAKRTAANKGSASKGRKTKRASHKKTGTRKAARSSNAKKPRARKKK
ncbi:MAG: hypothetical protein QW814_04010 [Methanothrix sp.]